MKILESPIAVYPDLVDDGLEHRVGPIPEAEGRVLRVVVDARVHPLRIITAYFDPSMRGKL